MATPLITWLPMFMWRRPEFQSSCRLTPPNRSHPRAPEGRALSPQQRRFTMDLVMMRLAVGSLLLAVANFVRDLVAG